MQNYFACMKEHWLFVFNLLVGVSIVAITTEKRFAARRRGRQVKHRYE